METEKQQEIEIEWKLQVTDAAAWPAIVEFVRRLPGQLGSAQFKMAARYFDTADLQLNQKRIAYRLRRENDALVATVKAGGSSAGGLHKRLEINRPVASEAADLSVFKGIDEIAAVVDYLEKAALQVIVETDFHREAVLLEQAGSRIEIALDQGSVRAGGQTRPILEVELELKSGNERELQLLGEEFQRRFPLRPEPKSKFFRGLLLSGLLKQK